MGLQAKYLIQGLLATGRYRFVCGGGAIEHPDNTPQRIAPEQYGEDWTVFPVNGYGDKNFVRQMLVRERPDALLFITDPRFYVWLWEMEDEVRQVCPMVYWHVWDNDPAPDFNRMFYESTDHVVALSLKTLGLLQGLGYERRSYIPHALPDDVFRPLPEEECARFKHDTFGPHRDKRFIAFWNNRNARRKQTGDVIASFAKFAGRVGRDRVALLMHTDPSDQEGQDITAVARKFGVDTNLIVSANRVPPEVLNGYYNACDVTVNISCFPAGAKVSTAGGYRNIEDIRPGELVLTHMGRMRPVVRTFSGMNKKPLYTLKATNCDPIVTTEDHRLWAVKGNEVDFLVKDDMGRLREMARWVPARELEVGDYLISRDEFVPKLVGDVWLDVWKHAKDEVFSIRGHRRETYRLDDSVIVHNTGDHGRAANERLLLDEDLAYIFGEWVADGSTNSCSVSFNKRDHQLAELLRQKYERVFGNEAYIRESARHIDVCLRNSSVYSQFLIEHCGAYSDGKFVPDVILQASPEIKRAFMAGYLAGDGCVLTHPQYGNKTNRVRTVSPRLAYGVRLLLSSLGYCVSVHDDENTGSYKAGARIWTLEWRERKRENNGSCRSWNDGRGLITRIFDVEVDENTAGSEVFNIEVDEDNTYHVSNIIVKNSNEGFGLSTLESLYAGTPIIAHFTGGLQFQVGDWWEGREDFSDQEEMTAHARRLWRSGKGGWWGAPVFPASRSCTGSQQIPYIYDDRVNHDDVVDALVRLYEMGRPARRELGLRARAWATERFNMKGMVSAWDRVLEEQILRHRRDGVVRHRVTRV